MKPKTEITERKEKSITWLTDTSIVASQGPGVLFIDEVHMLDQECFTFLNKARSIIGTVVILPPTEGVPVKGSDGMVAPHGIPVDLLDRLLIAERFPHERRKRTILACGRGRD